MAFITPIVDRTEADVLYALTNQNSSSDLKGALNISDLNRIESNTVFLRNTLLSYGYTATITTHATWTTSDFFYTTDIDRIKQNLKNIITGFVTIPNSPILNLGDYNLDYDDINDIEKVILDINNTMECMVACFLYSGQFYSCSDYITQRFA